MARIDIEKTGSVARVIMNDGKNLHNPEFLTEVLAAFDEVEKDETATALVWASSDVKNWSQGIDLQWMMAAAPNPERHQDVKDFMYLIDKLFARILLFPIPVIAELNGHAFGDGAIVSCACDFRTMRSDRGFFCFPEVDINIPFLPGMLAIVRKAIPEPTMNLWTLSGKRVSGEELVSAGVGILASEGMDKLKEDTMSFASTFSKSRGIFSEMKKRMNRHILEIMEKEDPTYIESLKLFV